MTRSTSLTTRRALGGFDTSQTPRATTAAGSDDTTRAIHRARRLTTSRPASHRCALRQELLGDCDGEENEQPAAKHDRPTTVLLVRHGQTNPTGKVLPGRTRPAPRRRRPQQAERAAERIAELTKVDAVYTSPLERARRDGGTDRRGYGHAGQGRPRPARVRLRRVDRRQPDG